VISISEYSKKLILQFLKYIVGGGVYFWTGYLIFAIGYSGFHLNWLWAKMIADAIGWTLGYVIQRYWAFANPALNRHPVTVTGRYVMITALNFAIDYGIVASLKHLGLTPYAGLFISSGFFTVWNYLWYRFFVFRVQSNQGINGKSRTSHPTN
jgi:putative flippase GtrA